MRYIISTAVVALVLSLQPLSAGTLTPDNLLDLKSQVASEMSPADAKLYNRHMDVLQALQDDAKDAKIQAISLIMSDMLDLIASYPELEGKIHPKG